MKTFPLALFSSVMLAQAPPLATHRTPPEQVDKQALGAQAAAASQLLAGGDQTAQQPMNQPAITGTITKAPPNYHPEKIIPLDSGIERALNLSQRLAMPTVEADGLIRYPYGDGVPTVVCAIGHLCRVDLEPGEAITTEPEVGDPSFQARPWVQALNGTPQSSVIVKPTQINRESSLFFETDRRSYDLRLVSRQKDYMPRIAFSYPRTPQEDGWQTYQAKLAELTPAKPAPAPPPAPVPAKPETWTLGYAIHGKKTGWWHKTEQHPVWWPQEVKDNGDRVWIRLPDIVAKGRAPLLMRKTEKAIEPMNYEIEGTTLIAHNLFDKAVLLSGKQEVYITSPRGKK